MHSFSSSNTASSSQYTIGVKYQVRSWREKEEIRWAQVTFAFIVFKTEQIEDWLSMTFLVVHLVEAIHKPCCKAFKSPQLVTGDW